MIHLPRALEKLLALGHGERDEPGEARRACSRFVARTRAVEVASDLTSRLAAASGLALAGAAFVLALDYAIAPGSVPRKLALLAVLVSSGALLLLAVVRAFSRRPNERWVARRIEERYPALDGRLATVLTSGATGAVDSIAPGVARELARASALSVPDRRRPRRRALAALVGTGVATGVVLLYSFLAPEQLGRALLLADEPGPAPRAILTCVKPGPARVIEGEPLVVTVGVAGDPAEARILVMPQDLQASADARAIPLARNAQGRFEARIPALLEDASYEAVVDGAPSAVFPVTVVHAPRVVSVSHATEPPAYLEEEQREVEGGDVDVVSGTKVTVRAKTASEPLRGKLVATWTEDGIVERVPLEVAGPHDVRASFVARRGGSYRIEYEDATGLRPRESASWSVAVRPDLPPRVEILAPARDHEIELADTLPIEYEARDDHALGELWLHVAVRGGRPRKLDLPVPKSARTVRGKLVLSPRDLGLLPGDSLVYYLAATDRKAPKPNRAVSSAYVLVVAENSRLREALSGIERRDDDVFRDLESSPPSSPENEDELARDRDAVARLERLLEKEPDPEEVAQIGQDGLREVTAEERAELEKALEDLDADESEIAPADDCKDCEKACEKAGKCPTCGRFNRCGTCGKPGHGRGCMAPEALPSDEAGGEPGQAIPGVRPRQGTQEHTREARRGKRHLEIARVPSRKEAVEAYRDLLDRRRELLRRLAGEMAQGRPLPLELARKLGPAAARLADALRNAQREAETARRKPREGSKAPGIAGTKSVLHTREEVAPTSIDLVNGAETSPARKDAPPASSRAPGWDERLPEELRAIVRAYFRER